MNRTKKTTLNGLEKTAILMNVLGKDQTYQIMKGMKDSDVRKLIKVMTHMKKAPLHVINAVLREYLHKLSERDEIIFEENLSSPKLISEGLGEERAKQIFGNTLKATSFSMNKKQLTITDSVDPKALAEFLSEEHPQTIAVVVAHLDSNKQVQLLKALPEAIRPEVVVRLANLEYVAPEKVDELESVLKAELLQGGRAPKGGHGGVGSVAEIVNNLDKKTMNSLMTRLEDKDPVLAEEIRSHMFTFTDIVKIDDRGVQLILRDVPGDKLTLALKSAPEEIREKIFRCMSERAAEMLKEDLSAMGPQRVSDVENAQREVVKVVRKLEEEGKLFLGSSDEQEVVA